MKCPICGISVYTRYDEYGQAPSITCPNIIALEYGPKVSHYDKFDTGWEGVSAYEEHAIAMPYKIINYYSNSTYIKPYCIIQKYDINQTRWGLRGNFFEIMRLDYLLEVLPYKKMQNRLKTIIVMS